MCCFTGSPASSSQFPLYEAAELDGATPSQKFFDVTIPQLRNTIAMTSILMVITGLTNFDRLHLDRWSPRESSTVLPLYVYNLAFFSNEYGYAIPSPCFS